MNQQQHNQNAAEKLTLLFMLAAIFLSLFFGLESYTAGRREAFHTELLSARRLIVEDVAAKTDPQAFITNQILPLLRLYSELPQTDLEKVRRDYLEKKGLDLTFFLFDHNGNLVKSAPERAGNVWLMRNLFAALREKDNRKVSLLRKSLDKKIEFSFGYGKDLNSIRENPETIISTAFDDKTGLIAWTSRPKGGLIVTSQNLPTDHTIFKLQAKRIRALHGLQKIGTLEQNYRNNKTPPAIARNYLNSLGSDSGSFAGRFWVFINSSTARTIFAAFADPTDPYIRTLHLGRLLLACLASALFFLLSSAGAHTTLSLKKLVITMFFASSLIPLSGIAFTSLENIEVYKQIHINKVRAAKEETLGNIVQNFNKYTASCSTTLMQLTQDPGIGHNDPKTMKTVQTVTSIFPDARITIRDSAGDTLYSNSTDASEGHETIFKSLGRRLIERYAPERLNELNYSGNLFSDSMVKKDDMGFGTLLNYPNRLQYVNTGNADQMLLYRLLPAETGRCAIVFVELSTFHTIKRYLQMLRTLPQTVDGTVLQISAFYPKGFRWSLPPSLAHEKETLDLVKAAHVTGKPQFRRFTGKTNGFALCVPSSELSGNCLVAFCSAEPLDKALSAMRSRMAMGSALAVIMVFSIALWLSRQLIAPLERLETGITALAGRKFETRLAVPPGQDEFTQLFMAFNDMMAESYDMQIAHNVQEGLVPSKFPELPEYSIHGMLRAASDLGGDCLDCFELPNGNLLFLVGDITGHGVGSALIMAFARAVTFHWSQSDQLSPTSLTDQIDQMLRQNRTKKMFMGIICGVLNIHTNEIELVAKGHIYPLILRKNGTKQWLGLPAYPLGIGKQQPARSLKFTLEPGDSILSMTDGFLEGYNRNMKTIGFDGIEAWAEETRSEDARQWVNNLEKRFREWCNDTQSDDLSILVLTRKVEKQAHGR